MKIAVITEILNTHSGSRAPIDLAVSLAQLKNQIIILAVKKKCDYALKKNLEKKGLTIILFPQSKLLAAIKLYFKLRKIKPRVISFHATLPFFIASKVSATPIVKTYYGTQLDAYYEKIFPKKPNFFDKLVNFLVNKLITAIEKIQFLLSDEVIAISKFVSNQAKTLYKTSIPFCYLGVSNLGKPELVNIKKRNFMLTVSRFTPYKGFHELIAASGNLPLVVAGSAQNNNYLQYLKKTKGPNCQILVDIPDSQLATLYKKCQFLASFDKLPFFGLPIIEAANYGKSTIALNYGAVPELIKNGKTGFIVNNSQEFLKKANLLFKNSGLAKKLGVSAAERAKKMFNFGYLAQTYNKIFNKVLSKKEKKSDNFLSLKIIFLVGIILRLLYLGHHDFWFDEVFSYFVARENLANLIFATAADTHPPFYYLILHFWLKIAGNSEVLLRLLSTIFGILLIYIVYLLGKISFNQKTAVVAALFTSLSPLLVYYSAETRMYILVTLLTTSTILFFFKLIKKWSTAYSFWFITTLTLSFYTNYYSLILLVSINLIILFFKKQLLARFLYLQTISLVLFLPWILIFTQNPHPPILAVNTITGLPAMFGSFVLGGTGIVTLREFFQPSTNIGLILIFTLTLIFFGVIFMHVLKLVKKNYNLKLAVIFLFAPIVVISLVNLVQPVFSVRATIIFAPIFYLIIASKVSQFKGNTLKFLIFLTFLLFLSLNFIFLTQPKFKGPALKTVSQANQNTIPILHSSILTYYPFKFYTGDNLNFLVGFSPLTQKTEQLIGIKLANLQNLPQKFIFVEIKNGQDSEKLANLKQLILQSAKVEKTQNIDDITLIFFRK